MAGSKDSEGKKKRDSSRLDEIGGYKVLPVKFDSGDDQATATHYIYFKQHSSSRDEILMPSSRTLFMYNLPADTTERDIKRLFQGLARVARVIFHEVVGQDILQITAIKAKMINEIAVSIAATAEKPASGRKRKQKKDSAARDEAIKPVARAHLLASGGSAHVVLLEDEEMENMLSMKAGVRQWPERDADDKTDPLQYRGLTRYLFEYRAARPPADLLKTDVDSYMAKFQEAQYERDRMLAQQQNVPDEDGFITVVRRGRNTRNSDGKNAVVAATAEEAREAAAKKKDIVFGNMYRFQVRERKRDQLAELRKKFEEDKEKIARMRQARQFRPY
ncbi:hypothetical protein J3B02_004335 [Coemansia erecta]|uniref:Ribosomal RNA-processing protein 7 n=1 Tax=Coemansia asiatica TaxID=1052880 RepID=A0A9W8CKR2_9FUNG|nr:hypothetical protein LPJ64_001293 [Coemansia asiatica]KAJ2846740.1 hypothetical protein J3B02_004335 [Coemansia erecta]KAJ2887398.1 hypothetical protein FB639_001348 [Coemansia asiatica]